MITIKDIAKAAGVSPATVSNVLNKRDGVSYEKIRLVEDTALRMGYHIDKSASALRKGSTKIIALFLPTISEACYCDLYMGVLHGADARGFSVRLFLTDDIPYMERKALAQVLAERMQGILTVSCLKDHSREYQAAFERNLPVLFLERSPVAGNFPCYCFDMEEAAACIARQIGPDKNVWALLENLCFANQSTLHTALCAKAGLVESHFFENLRGEQSSAAYELLSHAQHPSYLIAANEFLADHLQQMYAHGISSVPSIIALSSLRPSQNPSRYSVLLNYRLMGHDSVNAMMDLLENGRPLVSRVFPVAGFCAPCVMHNIPHSAAPLRVLVHRTPAVEALEHLLPLFTRETGIQVELNIVHLNTFFEEIHSCNHWDVMRFDPSSLSYLAPQLCMPLEQIDPQAQNLFSAFLPNLPDDFFRVGKVLYALPFDISAQLLFYQRSLFEDFGQQQAFSEAIHKKLKIPATYEDFDTVCRFFTRQFRSGSPTLYGSALPLGRPSSMASDFLPRLLASDGMVYTCDGRLNLMSKTALNTLKDYLRFTSCANSYPINSWGELAANFVQGQYALSILFLHHASHFIRSQAAESGVEIGCSPVPGGKSLLGGGSLAIGRASAQPEAAFKFIRWATGPEIAPKLVMMGGVSACSCVYEQRAILDTYPWLSKLPDAVRLGVRRPTLAFGSITANNQREFEYRLGSNIIDAIAGRKTPQEALRDTQDYLDSSFAGV